MVTGSDSYVNNSKKIHPGCCISTTSEQHINCRMEIQWINSTQVTMVVPHNLQNIYNKNKFWLKQIDRVIDE